MMAVFLSLAQTAHTDTIKSHIVGLPSLGESTAVKQMIDFLFLFFFFTPVGQNVQWNACVYPIVWTSPAELIKSWKRSAKNSLTFPWENTTESRQEDFDRVPDVWCCPYSASWKFHRFPWHRNTTLFCADPISKLISGTTGVPVFVWRLM